MTIKELLDELEQTKQNLLSLNLPENTVVVSPPDMGSLISINKTVTKFEPKEVFKMNQSFMLYPYVCGQELTQTEKVVIMSETYPRD
jgi:hypothetical protein